MKKIFNRNPKKAISAFEEKKEYRFIKYLVIIIVIIMILFIFNIFSIPIFAVWAVFAKNKRVIKKEQEDAADIIWNEPPDDLRPAEVGFLYGSNHGTGEIISILFYLINEGYISMDIITDKEGFTRGNYMLSRISYDTGSLRDYEKDFLDFVFQNQDVIYWHEFIGNRYSDVYLSKILFGIQQELQRRGYYYFGDGFENQEYGEALSKALKGNIFSNIWHFGSGLMRYRTEKGKALISRVMGFKNYLEKAERERIIFHADPEKMIVHIGDMMPYAAALDVYEEWQNELLGIENVGEDERAL